MFDRNNIDIFSSRDQIRNQIIEYAKNYLQLENVDLNNANYLGFLVNILSVLTSNLIYYNSSVSREFFLTKALQKESVLNLSSMLGYKAELAKPASCNILLEIPLNFNGTELNFTLFGINDIINNSSKDEIPTKFYADDIPFSVKYTTRCSIHKTNDDQFTASVIKEGTNGTISIPYTINQTDKILRFFIETLQVDILKGNDLEFIFETIRPFSFYSRDLKFKGDLADIKLFTFDDINITTEENSIVKSWQVYDSLFLIPENIYGFTYKKTDKGIRIFFGNGLIGKQPQPNTRCQVILSVTHGSKGNIIQGVINKADKVYTTPSGKLLSFNALNMEPAFGGKDSPKVDEIRSSAIAQVSTNKRLVTKKDYDYMNLVLEPGDLPINNSITVLKRSDIARNEINLFTDLAYHTIENEKYVVPTRNSKVIFDTTGGIDMLIRTGDEVYTDNDTPPNDYISMFNLEIDPVLKELKYSYIVDDVSKPFVMTRMDKTDSFITITSCDFKIIKNSSTLDFDRLTFNLNYVIYNNNPTKSNILPPQLMCQVRMPNGEIILLENNSANKYFSLNAEQMIYLKDLPYGEINFVFYVYDVLSDKYKKTPENEDDLKQVSFLIGGASVVIKEDLSEFMYSRISIPDSTSLNPIIIYDVPSLDKRYYNSINKSLFDTYVLNKIVTFDVTKYRMMTDFLNLKFSNTTGKIYNMKLNLPTRDLVSEINPISMPIAIPFGTRFAISELQNPWNTDPWFKKEPFIATYVDYGTNWIFEDLVVNDYIFVENLNKKMLFNGEIFVDPEPSIPLELEIVVWPEYNQMRNSEDLIKKIKTSLIDEFYPKFGYDKSIYISEITRIVKSIPGVKNCKVLKPQHDIQFLYNIYKDFTPEQLLEYTPELVYFDTSSIQIELR